MSTATYSLFESDIQTEIARLARALGKPEKTVMREVLQAGLKSYQHPPTHSVQTTLDLIAWAEKEQITSDSKDLSTKHTTYAWQK